MLRRTLALALLWAPLLAAAGSDRPNIVFILIDDLGREWVSAYGAEGIKTPRIDQLAAEGLKFRNAYSMPQCTPTRVTLLTGQYPFRHGWVNHWDVPRWGAGAHFDPDENLTFVRLLREAGYATAIAGKWQINDFRIQPDILRRHGFDAWRVWTGFETGNPPSAERYWDPFLYDSDGSRRTWEGRFGPDLYNQLVLDFLREHRDEPMFIYYPLALTHSPFVATPAEPGAESKVERHKAMVRYTDELIGRVVDALDELGLRERTYVIVTTDNGTSGGITGRIDGREIPGGKAKLTENGTRQPFIVSAPGRTPAGVETDALTDFSDVFPTVLDLAGVAPPKDWRLDGRSIAGVIRGEDRQGPREWILAMGFGPARLDEAGVRPVVDYADRVVRDKRYKVHVHAGKIIALYDLAEDPYEEKNLLRSERPEHRAALERLNAVVRELPEKDARPRYTPLPPQPWDLSRDENERMLGRSE